MKPIRVVLADFDPAEVERMRFLLCGEPEITVAGTAIRADEILPLLRGTGADVLVMNLQLVGGDGMLLLKQLSAEPALAVQTVIRSDYSAPKVVERAAKLGAFGYLERSCSAEALREYILLAAAEVPALSLGEQFLSVRTSSLLRALGLVPGRRGFLYLRHAICLWVQIGEDCTGVTKQIYPAVADACHTTPAAVERCIRQTLRRLWSETATAQRQRLFPPEELLDRSCPTNVRFISTAACYLNRTWGIQTEE